MAERKRHWHLARYKLVYYYYYYYKLNAIKLLLIVFQQLPPAQEFGNWE